ncbi:MAG: peptide chain release factor-like protein [Planctomycetota bacterium]
MLNRRELIQPLFVPAPHPASLDSVSLLEQCSITRNRATGPGGQHRNKVETHVTVTHDATGVSGQAGERRSPEVNKRAAIRRLRLALAVACRAPVPIGEIGSDMWRGRVRGGTIALNERHRDFPSMLAEALDVVYSSGLDVKRAALRLECTPSQLTKLIAKDTPALAALNEARSARGQRPLQARK